MPDIPTKRLNPFEKTLNEMRNEESIQEVTKKDAKSTERIKPTPKKSTSTSKSKSATSKTTTTKKASKTPKVKINPKTGVAVVVEPKEKKPTTQKAAPKKTATKIATKKVVSKKETKPQSKKPTTKKTLVENKENVNNIIDDTKQPVIVPEIIQQPVTDEKTVEPIESGNNKIVVETIDTYPLNESKEPINETVSIKKPNVKSSNIKTSNNKVTGKKDNIIKSKNETTTSTKGKVVKAISEKAKNEKGKDVIVRPQPKKFKLTTKEDKAQYKKLEEAFNYVANLTWVIEERTMNIAEIPDLTLGEVHVVEVVNKNNNKPMTLIAKKLKVTVGSLITCVNRLIQKDYLIRTRDEMDRRVILLSVTPKAKKAMKAHDKFHDDILGLVIESGVTLPQATKVMSQFANILEYYYDPSIVPTPKEKKKK